MGYEKQSMKGLWATAPGAYASMQEAPSTNRLAIDRACLLNLNLRNLNMSEGEKSGYSYRLLVKDGRFDSLFSRQPHDLFSGRC